MNASRTAQSTSWFSWQGIMNRRTYLLRGAMVAPVFAMTISALFISLACHHHTRSGDLFALVFLCIMLVGSATHPFVPPCIAIGAALRFALSGSEYYNVFAMPGGPDIFPALLFFLCVSLATASGLHLLALAVRRRRDAGKSVAQLFAIFIPLYAACYFGYSLIVRKTESVASSEHLCILGSVFCLILIVQSCMLLRPISLPRA